MQKRFTFSDVNHQYQEVFAFQDRALASIDQRIARHMVRVFGQAMATRLWSEIPMLPTRPNGSWKQEDRCNRRELQNTFQLNALSIDMGIDRSELAMVPNFREFVRRARESARLFDVRVGPPWWVGDRPFLEVAYVAAQEQEAPDADMNGDLWCHWGDDANDTPYWVAQNFYDHLHACEADILGQCVYARKTHQWTNEQYRDNVLLNWQVLMQPHLAICPDDEDSGKRRPDTFPHHFQLRRLVSLLNREAVNAANVPASYQGPASTAPRQQVGANALRRPGGARAGDGQVDHGHVRKDGMVLSLG